MASTEVKIAGSVGGLLAVWLVILLLAFRRDAEKITPPDLVMHAPYEIRVDSLPPDLLGIFESNKLRITISNRLQPGGRRYTIAHERCHAGLFLVGVQGLTAALEENVCDAMGVEFSR